MTAISSSLTKADDGTSLVQRASLQLMAGVEVLLTRAEFDAMVTAERARISGNSVGIYPAGERRRIIGEAGTRVWFLATGGSDAANAAASHMRTVDFGQGNSLVLAADANVALAAASVAALPASGAGSANGDVGVVWGSGIFVRTAGAWPATPAISLLLAGSVYSSPIGISIPSGWGANWKAALVAAQAGTGLARLALVGDSMTAGLFVSNLDTKPLAGKLATRLQAIYGDGGSGYKSSYDTALSIGSSAYTSSVAASSLIALTGTWAVTGGIIDGPGSSVLVGSAVGSTATYVVRGTTVKTFVTQFSGAGAYNTGGQYTVQIDGGTVQGPYLTNSSAGSATNAIQVQTYSGLSAGNHTVVVRVSDTTGGNVYYSGVMGLNASGVVVHKYGRGSYPSGAFNNGVGDTFYQSSGTTTGGSNKGVFGPAGKWSGGSLNPADLVIYSCGINDATASGGHPATPDGYLANVRDFLDDVRAAGTTDVLILMQHISNFGQDTSKPYPLFCERMESLAKYYGAAFVSLGPIGKNSYAWLNAQGYVGNATTAGAAGTDGHMSDAGFAWQDSIVGPLITL